MAFNVLVVDDSSSIRAIIKKIIRVSGFNVGEFWDASDGLAALSILKEQWVDIVLTDINMPNMNGMELIAQMKQDDVMVSIPVVVVSTEGSEKTMREAMAMGALGYVKKPFVPEDIKQTLNGILGVEDGQADVDEDDEALDF